MRKHNAYALPPDSSHNNRSALDTIESASVCEIRGHARSGTLLRWNRAEEQK